MFFIYLIYLIYITYLINKFINSSNIYTNIYITKFFCVKKFGYIVFFIRDLFFSPIKVSFSRIFQMVK